MARLLEWVSLPRHATGAGMRRVGAARAQPVNTRYRLGVILETINGPSDLRRLDNEQLTTLAAEIRDFIVHAVSSANSGHLGSNLGVVELTLALHRVFSSPATTSSGTRATRPMCTSW